MTATLLQILLLFAGLSLLAVGGGNGVIPAMQRAAVDVHHWMTNREFIDMFAISRAAPGPGSMIVLLIGQKAAGLAGALAAGLAMYTPSCLLVHFAARVWSRYEAAAWRRTAERALAPIAVGLTFASGLALMQTTERGWLPWGTTLAATVVLAATDINPLVVLGVAAGVALGAGG
jgi:chromate transporter